MAERQDRKVMWLLPPCGAGVPPLELRLLRAAGRWLRGLSVFATVSFGLHPVPSAAPPYTSLLPYQYQPATQFVQVSPGGEGCVSKGPSRWCLGGV